MDFEELGLEVTDSSSGRRYLLCGRLSRNELTGCVYAARDRQTSEDVVIKQTHPVLGVNETMILQRIASPGLPRMRACGEFGSFGWAIVFDRVHGPDFYTVLADRRVLPPREAAETMRQILAVLERVHRAGFVHRDMKPANVIRDPTAGPVIIDFGIATAWSPGAPPDDWWGKGGTCGTPTYTPPEQIGGRRPPHPTADIYSCGAFLYDLLQGRPPFVGKDQDVLLAHESATPPPLIGISPPLEAVVMCALQKDPGDRFQTADEMRCALDAALARL